MNRQTPKTSYPGIPSPMKFSICRGKCREKATCNCTTTALVWKPFSGRFLT